MAEVVLTDVTKRFGANTALDAVSLTVPNGAFVVLLGPTGAGKTTTLRMISGLDTPDSGVVRVGGRPMATRCISPPESAVALLSSLWPICRTSATAPTFRAISSGGVARSGERSGKARFSRTVMCG